MRVNKGYTLALLVVALVAGVGLGTFVNKIPSVLVVHCPDGFQIEIHGEFPINGGHRMRSVFCENEEWTNEGPDTFENDPNSITN